MPPQISRRTFLRLALLLGTGVAALGLDRATQPAGLARSPALAGARPGPTPGWPTSTGGPGIVFQLRRRAGLYRRSVAPIGDAYRGWQKGPGQA